MILKPGYPLPGCNFPAPLCVPYVRAGKKPPAKEIVSGREIGRGCQGNNLLGQNVNPWKDLEEKVDLLILQELDKILTADYAI